jgi:hypothetical protein
MKLRTICTGLLALLLTTHHCFAQAEPEQGVSYERMRIVPLESYRYKKKPDLGFPLQGIEIINNVWDTTRLGFVQVGMMNKKIGAFFDTTMHAALQQFTDKQYSSYYQPVGKRMLWVINELRINERTSFTSERAYVYLNAAAYLEESGGQFRVQARVDTVLERGGMDVIKKHEEHIGEALHLLFTQSTAGKAGGEAMSREAVIDKEAARYDLPILKDPVLEKGVYTSFKEFKNNAPSVKNFTAKEKRGKLTVYQVLEDGSEVALEKVWGLCSDRELYKYLFGDLIALEQVGKGFVVSNYLESINRRNKAIFWSSMLGGAIGAGIASGSNKVYEVTALPYIKYNRPEATCINMQNGTLSF